MWTKFDYYPWNVIPDSNELLPVTMTVDCQVFEVKFLSAREMNEKFAQFCLTVKKRMEAVSPPIPPNRHHDDRIASWEEKGERGHNGTCVISV
ncbi:hypothetical protein TNCV_2024131 [Trichonephila clavipes]|nr:hypothetical protein TNCV_2024131 [Trichonephila clavipes]